MTDQYRMTKREFDARLVRTYLERKDWLHYMYDGSGERMRWRVLLHWDKRKGLLPPAHYTQKYAPNIMLLLQRSKPKHLLKYTPIITHLGMIMKRKPWKRGNSHSGPLFWRNFW